MSARYWPEQTKRKAERRCYTDVKTINTGRWNIRKRALTSACTWKKNIRMTPWPDLYSRKKWTIAYCERSGCVDWIRSIKFTHDRSSERSIQPPTTLSNEFGSSFGHIRFGLRGFDICQSPSGPSLGNQLETEDAIFCQEHVLGENVHPIYTLGP